MAGSSVQANLESLVELIPSLESEDHSTPATKDSHSLAGGDRI